MQHASSIDDVIAINNLPAINPTGGGLIDLTSAQERALGILPANSTVIDGVIGFSAANWDFNSSAGISPGQYDFLGTAEHEITHALGRMLESQIAPSAASLLDLLRYSAPGNLHVAPGQPSYFSIDGGRTDWGNFASSGDLSDWAGSSVPPDANDNNATPGQVNPLTDLNEMGVLGFSLNLPLDNNVALPAPAMYESMYGSAPSSTELWTLKEFDAAQSSYAQAIGIQSAVVYMYSALGQALADRSDTGSTAFSSTWGPQTISSDAALAAQAYDHVFGTQGTQAQVQHFIDQLSFYNTIYETSGAYGTDANYIDLLARGAIYGQMLGVQAADAAQVLTQAATQTVPTDTQLVGVSQHDMTQNEAITATTGDAVTMKSGTGETITSSGLGVNAANATGFTIKGTADVVYAGLNAAITDGGSSTKSNSNVGNLAISSFGADPTRIIDLLNGAGGYTSASKAFAVLTSDGAGGSKLSLGSDGSIDFANVAPSSLHASNFKIG
jgi:hypothetical protein